MLITLSFFSLSFEDTFCWSDLSLLEDFEDPFSFEDVPEEADLLVLSFSSGLPDTSVCFNTFANSFSLQVSFLLLGLKRRVKTVKHG